VLFLCAYVAKNIRRENKTEIWRALLIANILLDKFWQRNAGGLLSV
jgi:hypothetical protein